MGRERQDCFRAGTNFRGPTFEVLPTGSYLSVKTPPREQESSVSHQDTQGREKKSLAVRHKTFFKMEKVISVTGKIDGRVSWEGT